MNGASSSINSFNISSSTNQATFYYHLSTTGITNTGTINSTGNIYLSVSQSLYIGQFNYIRVHHSGAESFIDYTDGLNFCSSGITSLLAINSSTNQASFNYNLNTTGITNSSTNAIINNGILTQNAKANINSDLNVTGTTMLNCNGSTPTGSTGGTQGIAFFWNANSGMGDSAFLNYGQNGAGGFSFHTTGNGTATGVSPTQLMTLDSAKN